MEWGEGGGGSRNVQRIASDSPLQVVVFFKLERGDDTASCIRRCARRMSASFVQVNAVYEPVRVVVVERLRRAIGRTVPGESARIEERGGDKLHQMKCRQGQNVERPLDLRGEKERRERGGEEGEEGGRGGRERRVASVRSMCHERLCPLRYLFGEKHFASFLGALWDLVQKLLLGKPLSGALRCR